MPQSMPAVFALLCATSVGLSWSLPGLGALHRDVVPRYLHCYTHQIKIDNNSKLETWLHSWTFWANKLRVCTLLSKNLIAREQLCLGMQHHLKKQNFATRQHFSYLIILLIKCMFSICFIFSPAVITTHVAHVDVQSIACGRYSNECASSVSFATVHLRHVCVSLTSTNPQFEV